MKKTIIGVVSLATLICLGGLYLNKEEKPKMTQEVKQTSEKSKTEEVSSSGVVDKEFTIDDCRKQITVKVNNDILESVFSQYLKTK